MSLTDKAITQIRDLIRDGSLPAGSKLPPEQQLAGQLGLSDEVNRFDAACSAAADELDAIVSRVSQQVGDEEAAIFKAHRALLRDPN